MKNLRFSETNVVGTRGLDSQRLTVQVYDLSSYSNYLGFGKVA